MTEITAARSAILRSAAGIAALLTVSAGLTGCGIGFTPQSPATEKPAPSSSHTETPSTSTSEGASAAASEGAASAAGSASGSTGASGSDDSERVTRAMLEPLVEKHASCVGGTVEVVNVGTTVAIDGNCATVKVSANGASVLANDVAKLQITGTGVTVFTKRLDALDVTGNGNTVAWESGSPAISDAGIGNVLAPAS
ncbi:DUF3060 domain-containing protein [Leucobacter sp. HNU]|uniref:DUF3060 domain-containing protein n=1 Tax=Leucobacter sp. HNU TaxID=3236805 RepID=UPI003A7F651E